MSVISDRQWLFNVTLKTIREQGKPSVGEDAMCAYRGGEQGELRCGAAPFVIDYHPDMESRSFRYVVDQYPESVDPRAKGNWELVQKFQYAHDGAHNEERLRSLDNERPYSNERFVEKFETFMKGIAQEEGLSYTTTVGELIKQATVQ